MIAALHKGILVNLFLILALSGVSQSCDLRWSGHLLDEYTGIPLPYSNLFLEEEERGLASDSLGFFEFENLCAGVYQMQISRIGYEPKTLEVLVEADTSVVVLLVKEATPLDEVIVEGSYTDQTTEVSSRIDQEEIARNSSKNLGDVLESMTGVSVLKTGAGVSKPIIHGLSGNRISILNNGIEQSGQQWGNDHAPEIDPSVANQLTVVKGTSALAYGGNALGAVVLVETKKITREPGLKGSLNYTFQSNGLGNTLNSSIEKNGRWAAWRISGTLKMIGDAKTPNYFLTNTGRREANLAFQVEKKFSDRWFNEFYFSSFNTSLGVLRGAHVGNLTDLNAALNRDIPFFTKDEFSYEIEAPKQEVGHHLVKWQSKYFINDQQVLQFKYGGQFNNRKEFDVRRGGRSDTPTLSLQQFSNFAEATYQHNFAKEFFLKTGLQYEFVDNTNNPETGIVPLLPNYEAHSSSAFLILQQQREKLFYEIGARYDLKYLDVVTISNTLPRSIVRFDHQFHNYAFSSGLNYNITKGLKANFNLGYSQRAPEVNELYSFGLHQGVSGIEEGSSNLNPEKSLKGIASLDWNFRKKIFLQTSLYYQNIQDYIYLQPQNEFRLTIRGAFPVFIYEQTDARIQGLDFQLSYEPTEHTKWVFKYAHVNGRDLSNNTTLINIPADNLFSSFSYSLNDKRNWKENSISVNGRYTFQKQNIAEEQDYTAPPNDYFLLGLNMSTLLQLSNSSIRFSLSAENLLNTSYRDYLNRQRYFAEEMGINVLFNMQYEF